MRMMEEREDGVVKAADLGERNVLREREKEGRSVMNERGRD